MDTKFRRWINQYTAVGPRNKGGLNVMDWQSHVRAFMTNWIIRNLYPDNSSWKTLLDHFILDNRYNQEKFPEGRMILLCNITPYQKMSILKRIPFRYMKKALIYFWQLGIKQDISKFNHLDGESLWHNWRFTISIPFNNMQYFKNTINRHHSNLVIEYT